MDGVIGQYLLFEACDEDKNGDVIWLARAVADEGLGGRCCKQMSKRTLLHRDESRSTAFSVGDWAIAVEWIERTGSDPERLTFGPSDGVVCFVNSTELRHIVAKGGVFPRPDGQAGGGRAQPQGRGRRPGLVPVNSEPKIEQQDMQVVPRAHASDTRAMQLCSSHSDVTPPSQESEHQKPGRPKTWAPGPSYCPPASFYSRIRLISRRRIRRDTARAAALRLSTKKYRI